MDTLVARGTSAAYGYSCYALGAASHNRPCCRSYRTCAMDGHCFHGHHYFETSALLIAFVLLGKYLEARAKGKTSRALRALLELQPARAVVLCDDQAETVDAAALRRGDVEMLAVGRVARSAAGSKLVCAVLVHMQEGSQKESRWQAQCTDDWPDTATTTCTGRHLPNWGRR